MVMRLKQKALVVLASNQRVKPGYIGLLQSCLLAGKSAGTFNDRLQTPCRSSGLECGRFRAARTPSPSAASGNGPDGRDACPATFVPPALRGRNSRHAKFSTSPPLRRCTRRYSSQREVFHPAGFRSAKTAATRRYRNRPSPSNRTHLKNNSTWQLTSSERSG